MRGVTTITMEDIRNEVRLIPLEQRLKRCVEMIGNMCSKGRCPEMSIPAMADDEDIFIVTTLMDAAAEIKALRG